VTERPSRLGRGLEALLGGSVRAEPPAEPVDDEPAVAAPDPAGEMREPSDAPVPTGLTLLDVDAVSPNPKQPRSRFAEEALQALAASIAESGLVQPIVVRPVGEGRYELIAGERRWQASRRAGLTAVPAVVRDADERERLELALVENVVREDLNPMELARGVAALVEDFGRTHDAVAQTLGRSRPAISNLLRLLELPEPVQEMVAGGALSEGHARAVLMADGAGARRRLAERMIAEGLTVRQAEALARGEERRRAPARVADEPRPAEARALDVLYGVFEVPVRVRPGRGDESVVELRFPDQESLQRALDRLGD